MKNRVVLVPFPFDDLSATKVRPAICLSNEIKPYGHVVLAFVTSRVSADPSLTDLTILDSEPDFAITGQKVSSTVRLHRMVTVSRSIIKRELGEISLAHQTKIKHRLQDVFEI